MIVRPATAEDLAGIAAIQSQSPEASQWHPPDYLKHDCLVAEETQVVGFLVARQIAPEEREVLNVAVDPAHRRHGVARALLQADEAYEPNQ